MRTLITSNSHPLAPEAVAQMIADFKRRNPHVCDDVEELAASSFGEGEQQSDTTAENAWND
jgi:hypothetical protein